jgi:hypothetical protein
MLAWILAALLAGVGGGLICYAGLYGIRAALRRWGCADAQIAALEFSPVVGESTEIVILVFHYEVQGTPYEGRQIIYESAMPLTVEHRHYINSYYSVGLPLRVYYPAAYPQRAQLERDVDDTLFFLFVLLGTGLLLIILAHGWASTFTFPLM